MSKNFETCIASVLEQEGGYQCDPKDPGNWTEGHVGMGDLVGTNLGVSAPQLGHYLDRTPTAGDMRELTRDQAMEIYAKSYWAPIAGDELPLALAFVTLDAAVNSGPGQAAHWLQGALAVEMDGHIGPITITACEICNDAAGIVKDFSARRLAFLQALPTWPRYGRGWQERVERVQAAALALLP